MIFTDAMTPASASRLSAEWAGVDVGLYLDRCQIDTPDDLVAATWRRVRGLRETVGSVVDFGAGDGRFARGGSYASYTGYEVDLHRIPQYALPAGARIEHGCAFSADVAGADLCIGNPPFVRNQDLPEGWRTQVAERLWRRSGIRLSGLANAWQYFFLLSLLSAAEDGLCALVMPYEWVSRPSAATLRDWIRSQGWNVHVHRLSDRSFSTVLTTASITIVDKRNRDGAWRYYETDAFDQDTEIVSTTGAENGHIAYARRAKATSAPARAIRGLSPGTQQVFVLTEGERARLGLKPGRDVVRCVTSLRHLPAFVQDLDLGTFDRLYRHAGHRCWLIKPSQAEAPGSLRAYLESVQSSDYATKTCMERERWWEFRMPETPAALIATCFKGVSPKATLNSVGAIAVGGVAGLHSTDRDYARSFLEHLREQSLKSRIVPHANQLIKLEIGQINTLISEHDAARFHD